MRIVFSANILDVQACSTFYAVAIIPSSAFSPYSGGLNIVGAALGLSFWGPRRGGREPKLECEREAGEGTNGLAQDGEGSATKCSSLRWMYGMSEDNLCWEATVSGCG